MFAQNRIKASKYYRNDFQSSSNSEYSTCNTGFSVIKKQTGCTSVKKKERNKGKRGRKLWKFIQFVPKVH